MITRHSATGQLLQQFLMLCPDWRSHFDDSDPRREPQVVLNSLTEDQLRLLNELSSALGNRAYLHVHLRSFEAEWEQELIQKRQAKQRQQEELRDQHRLECERQARKAELAVHAEPIRQDLEQDYLAASCAYAERYASLMSESEFLDMRKAFIGEWLQTRGISPLPDDEQLAAIAIVEGNVRVVARAGSGKTTTLIRRFLFLLEHCRVQPHEMLLLAFNRKAAQNMRVQFEKLSSGRIPHIMTFHALAYALVHPEQAILMDGSEGQSKSRTLQTLIDGLIQLPAMLPRVRNVMLRFFRQDWEDIINAGFDKEPAALLEWRRSIPRLGLDSQDYKSRGEKRIADFLFEHDVLYEYERRFDWQGIPYKPDFTLLDGTTNRGLIIEYFGLLGDPDYDKEAERKRKFWAQRPDWNFMELTPADFSAKTRTECYQLLRERISEYGLRCQPLSQEQLWERIQQQQPLYRLTQVAVQFIQRCRQQAWSQADLYLRIAQHPAGPAEREWLELTAEFYGTYLGWLEDSGEEDFDGLLLKAAQRISAGQTRFSRKDGEGDLRQLRFIAVDEYQDFSELFHRLLAAIRQQAPQARAFCVGDDWQAINGFAGSDLRFFNDFADYFPTSMDCYITTNYRSNRSIVELANQLMLGRGTPARSFIEGEPAIYRVDVEAFQPSERERHLYNRSAFAAVVIRLVNRALLNNRDVVLLARTSYLKWAVAEQGDKSRSWEVFLEWVRKQFSPSDRNRITASTTHRYKGREKSVVIVLDALRGRYPLIHPDSQFFRLFGDNLDSLIEAERRLFYVAITRPQHELYLLTRSQDESPFMHELLEQFRPLQWDDYPPLSGDVQRIMVILSNIHQTVDGGTHSLKQYLKQSGYRWNPADRSWSRSFAVKGFAVSAWSEQSTWLSEANGIQARFEDDQGKILARYNLMTGKPIVIFDRLAEGLVKINQADPAPAAPSRAPEADITPATSLSSSPGQALH